MDGQTAPSQSAATPDFQEEQYSKLDMAKKRAGMSEMKPCSICGVPYRVGGLGTHMKACAKRRIAGEGQPSNPVDADAPDILVASQKLLDSLSEGDFLTFRTLCDPNMTFLGTETNGHLVEGLEFHKYFFDTVADLKLRGLFAQTKSIISSPKIRVNADMGIITYVRLEVKSGLSSPITSAAEETRVWERKNGNWVQVHYHTSAMSAAVLPQQTH